MDTAIEQQGSTIRFGWWSVSLWIGLTFLGYLLGVVFHFPGDADPYLFRINGIEWSAFIAGFVFGALSGLICGALQWIVIFPWMPTPRLWLALNVVGWGLV